MSRLDRQQYEYSYGRDSPSWESRTYGDGFISPGRRSAAGMAYDGPERIRPRDLDRARVTGRDRDRDRETNRDRDRDRDAEYVFVDKEKENLKQRLSRTSMPPLEPGAAAPRPPSSAASLPARQNSGRTRSLSLSRVSSPDQDRDRDRDRDREYYGHRPRVKYYQHERLSLSSPRVPLAGAGWPLASSRPASRSPGPIARPGPDRDRYERGFQLVEQRHSQSRSADPMLSISSALRDDPRFGMQRLSLDVNGPMSRMPINRRASFDAERDGGLVRRKAPSMSPGRGIMSPAHQVFRPAAVRPQYNQVHALILTWSFHDLKTAPYTAQPDPDYISLEDETRRLRDTLRSYGYHVHEFLIPMVRSVEQLQSRLRQFCRYAADDTLLMVYYHGHGSLDDDNELVFSSHEHPDDPDWSAAAAADLYEALMTGDPYAHSRSAQVSQLLKKYERYRPVAEVKWDDIRTAVLGAPCDMLLVLDCCAAGGANLGHASWQPPPSAEGYTKHLFAACGFESSTSDDMTAALCDVLDEWVPPSPTPPASQQLVQQQQQQDGRQRSRSRDARAAPFLTTKRLHQIVEDRLQKDSAGSQPIFKQLLPLDPEQYITLPNLLVLQQQRQRDREVEWAHAVDAAKRRGYILA